MSVEGSKRRPGRPPKPPGERKRRNLTIRLRDKLRSDLESRARLNQRSLSEEAEARLERSFADADAATKAAEAVIEQALGGPSVRPIATGMTAAFIHEGSTAAGQRLPDPKDWVRDQECYRSALLAVVKQLLNGLPDDSDQERKATIETIWHREQSRIANRDHGGFRPLKITGENS